MDYWGRGGGGGGGGGAKGMLPPLKLLGGAAPSSYAYDEARNENTPKYDTVSQSAKLF